MANTLTAAANILVDRIKIGEATDGDWEIRNGSEVIPIADGVALTDGRVTTTLNFKVVIPRTGMRARLFEAIATKKTVKIQIPVDGKYHEAEGKLMSGKATFEHAGGKTTGDFSFVGGPPQIL